jgi:hypothetical protein
MSELSPRSRGTFDVATNLVEAVNSHAESTEGERNHGD